MYEHYESLLLASYPPLVNKLVVTTIFCTKRFRSKIIIQQDLVNFLTFMKVKTPPKFKFSKLCFSCNKLLILVTKHLP